MKKTLGELFILLIICSLIIFFQFNEVPKKLSWDEVEFSRLALSLKDKPHIPYSELATGHSTIYFYLILASFQIFGITNFALRFPAALFGVLSVGIFYLIAKDVFAKIRYSKNSFSHPTLISYLLSLILVTNRWYFNFARFSFEATFLLFLELMSIVFLLKLLSRFRFLYLFICSLFSGLAFLSYTPGRIFFLLPLFFVFFHLPKKALKKNVTIFLTVFFITISPLLIYFFSHKDLRVEEQLFLIDKKLSFQNKVQYVGLNLAKISGMFNLWGDLNGRHNYPGKPILNPVMGAFFLFGMLVAVLNWRKLHNLLFLLLFFISILPALFTYPAENPNILRTYSAIVPVVYFIGNGLVYLLSIESKSKISTYGIIIVVMILFILASLYDLRTYFLYQREVFKKSFELNGSINKIINLKLWEKNQQL